VNVGDLYTQDQRQARGLDALLVCLGDHARVRDHSDVGQMVGGHRLLNDRQHRLGLDFVPFEGADHEGEPVLPGGVGIRAPQNQRLRTDSGYRR
jgi:hypothetical protein